MTKPDDMLVNNPGGTPPTAVLMTNITRFAMAGRRSLALPAGLALLALGLGLQPNAGRA